MGCSVLTAGRYCEAHAPIYAEEKERKRKERDKRRGGSRQRGYTTKWSKFSKWFLSQPEHQFCCLHLDSGCAIVAQCVDHIKPPTGANDPLFWQRGNHQPACLHCNSVKGHRELRGSFVFAETKSERTDADGF